MTSNATTGNSTDSRALSDRWRPASADSMPSNESATIRGGPRLRSSSEPEASEPVILVENLTAGYGRKTILENVNLSVRKGEVLTILGPSGCGKTTLFKVLTGLLRPLEGRVRIAGVDITSGNTEESLALVRKQIGVLFQSGALLDSLTIAQNVALPLREFTDLPRDLIDRVVRLKLDLVKLGSQGHLLPAQLSGGMNKRAALARAMALDPQILFCDEPSAGLDPGTALEIDGLLLELNAHLGVTLVLISHELASVENIATRCVILDCAAKGIIASGTLDELKRLSTDPRLKAFFSRRFTSLPPRGRTR